MGSLNRRLSLKGLHLVRISGDQLVLKRGLRELLVGGSGVEALVESLLSLLDGTRTGEEAVAIVREEDREHATRLLERMVARGLAIASDDEPPEVVDDRDQAAFYANFGSMAAATQTALRADIVILGATYAARALVRGLLELGVGRVTVVDLPELRNRAVPSSWVGDLRRDHPASGGVERVQVAPALLSEAELASASLLCATSDFGPVDMLLDGNRMALNRRVPFLPVWVSDMIGHVGPLTHPFDTACLRCYRLRADSNDPRREISAVVRTHLQHHPEAARTTGLLPPMAGVVGEVAALEVAKLLGGFAPVDCVGRLIEVNLVSFRSKVRRVLKVPRCPDCGEPARRAPRVVAHGPQIGNYDGAPSGPRG